MDLDPNDLLSTNVFINEPQLNDTIPDVANEEFKKFYLSQQEKNKEKQVQSKLDLRTTDQNEESDVSSLLNTNKFNNETGSLAEVNGAGSINSVNMNVNRVKKDIKTLISIDSRDRDRIAHPLPSNFSIFLGKTFYNVREVRLVSLEFPNTNAVINSNNDLIYWINKEDIDLDVIDNVTNTYPVYKAKLRTGSYVLNSLQTEMIYEMGLIKRSNPSRPFYHYFVITLDIDTDVVTFVSLILSQLTVNPLTTIVNTGVITVNAPSHGYVTGDNVYILGATSTAGIQPNTLNGFHKIVVINSNTFQYEVNINASDSLTGGGNTVQTGTAAPFQFLFGEYPHTVAQNIGYPLENSSTLITTNISSITNFYQLKITAIGTRFESTYDFVNNNVILNNTGGFLDNNGAIGNTINGVRAITHVINSTTFLVSVSGPLYETVYVTQAENNTGTGDIVTGSNYLAGIVISQSGTSLELPVMLQQTNNYYKGWWVKVISGDGTNNVREIVGYSATTNTITLNSAFITDLQPNDIIYLYSAPTFTFNSQVYSISAIQNYEVETVLFTFFTPHNYNLQNTGDKITFFNTTSNPSLDGEHVITGIPSSTTLFIAGYLFNGGEATTTTPGEIGYIPSYNLLTTKTLRIANVTLGSPTIITTTIDHELAVGDSIYIEGLIISPQITGVFTVYTIPNTNSFTINIPTTSIDVGSIANAYIGTNRLTLSFPEHGFNTIILVSNGPVSNTIDIQTQLPHNLETNDLIRIMNTGIVYIDNNSFVVTKLTNDTFRISVVLPSGYVATSTSGILGMSNQFRLYNCPTIGGILPKYINNVLVSIHEIIDENTLVFHLPNSYATTTETAGSSIYISSFKHGFTATQTNTKNNLLNRSINLEGENYAFLCCPQLSTMLNTGVVKNIFARIILDQSPGTVVFNFLSNPKRFETVPLQYLDTLSLSVLNYDSSLYVFNDLDFSFTLEITEVVDTTESFNISSKRGISDITKQY